MVWRLLQGSAYLKPDAYKSEYGTWIKGFFSKLILTNTWNVCMTKLLQEQNKHSKFFRLLSILDLPLSMEKQRLSRISATLKKLFPRITPNMKRCIYQQELTTGAVVSIMCSNSTTFSCTPIPKCPDLLFCSLEESKIWVAIYNDMMRLVKLFTKLKHTFSSVLKVTLKV